MPMEIENARFFFLAAGCTTQNFNVEIVSSIDVINGKCKVERPQCLRRGIIDATNSANFSLVPIALPLALTHVFASELPLD